MSELSAAMGLTSLESLDEFVAANRRNHESYTRRLGALDGVAVLGYDDGERHNYHYVVADVSPSAALSRDELIDVLHAENVLARRYFCPGCHRLEPYARSPLALPVTDDLAGRTLVLPTGTAVGEGDIDVVASIVRLALANADVVRGRLRAR
jgi:dTDP-4-amino-4,6-dideoxygalactose transaminase